MQLDPMQFIAETVEHAAPLEREYTLAEWESAVSGTPEANRRTLDTQAALLRFWADPDRYALAERHDAESATYDPITARQIRLIRLENFPR